MFKLTIMNKVAGYVLLFFGAIISASCTQVEGCMEPFAANYDAEADKNCCCSYYQLEWDVEHMADSFNVAYFTKYLDANNDSFELKSAAFLISEVQLERADGSVARIRNESTYSSRTGEDLLLTDDFAVLRPGSFVNEIGDFLELGSYVKVRFLLGLNDTAAMVDAAAISDAALPLAAAHNPSMWSGTDFQYNTATWETIIPSTADTLRFQLRDTLWLEFDYPIDAVDGADTKIPLTIDYLTLYQDVSWANDDSLSIVQKIKNNLRNAFSIP